MPPRKQSSKPCAGCSKQASGKCPQMLCRTCCRAADCPAHSAQKTKSQKAQPIPTSSLSLAQRLKQRGVYGRVWGILQGCGRTESEDLARYTVADLCRLGLARPDAVQVHSAVGASGLSGLTPDDSVKRVVSNRAYGAFSSPKLLQMERSTVGDQAPETSKADTMKNRRKDGKRDTQRRHVARDSTAKHDHLTSHEAREATPTKQTIGFSPIKKHCAPAPAEQDAGDAEEPDFEKWLLAEAKQLARADCFDTAAATAARSRRQASTPAPGGGAGSAADIGIGWSSISREALSLVAFGVAPSGGSPDVSVAEAKINGKGWHCKDHLKNVRKDLEDLQDSGHKFVAGWKNDKVQSAHHHRVKCKHCHAHAEQVWRELRVRIAERAMRQGRADGRFVASCSHAPAPSDPANAASECRFGSVAEGAGTRRICNHGISHAGCLLWPCANDVTLACNAVDDRGFRTIPSVRVHPSLPHTATAWLKCLPTCLQPLHLANLGEAVEQIFGGHAPLSALFSRGCEPKDVIALGREIRTLQLPSHRDLQWDAELVVQRERVIGVLRRWDMLEGQYMHRTAFLKMCSEQRGADALAHSSVRVDALQLWLR